jgi:hypothetical protein
LGSVGVQLHPLSGVVVPLFLEDDAVMPDAGLEIGGGDGDAVDRGDRRPALKDVLGQIPVDQDADDQDADGDRPGDNPAVHPRFPFRPGALFFGHWARCCNLFPFSGHSGTLTLRKKACPGTRHGERK